jgi:hypothetical protein
MVSKANFKLVGSRSNILKLTFITRNEINYVIGSASNRLFDLINVTSGKTSKIVRLHQEVLTKVTFLVTFKATIVSLYKLRIVDLIPRGC